MLWWYFIVLTILQYYCYQPLLPYSLGWRGCGPRDGLLRNIAGQSLDSFRSLRRRSSLSSTMSGPLLPVSACYKIFQHAKGGGGLPPLPLPSIRPGCATVSACDMVCTGSHTQLSAVCCLSDCDTTTFRVSTPSVV